MSLCLNIGASYHGLSVKPVEKFRHTEVCFFVCGIPLDRVPMSSLPQQWTVELGLPLTPLMPFGSLVRIL